MSKPLANRIALVTGASRGIGAAVALALAEAGAHVVAVARTVGGLEDLDDKIRAAGSSATLVPLDMKDSDGILRLGVALQERHGKLDVLVGNAGVLGALSPLDHIEPKVWDDAIAVNVTANWHLIRALTPLLKTSDAGRAVFISSTAATSTRAYWGPYAVSKAALEALVRTFAAETASTAIRVNAFSPPQTRSRLHAAAYPGVDPDTLPAPETVVKKLLPLCLPSFTETGKLYDYRAGKLVSFQLPT